jgi:hypothetical protein
LVEEEEEEATWRSDHQRGGRPFDPAGAELLGLTATGHRGVVIVWRTARALVFHACGAWAVSLVAVAFVLPADSHPG